MTQTPPDVSMDRDIRGVLFDIDGTLVDTTYLHTLAWWHCLHQQGVDIPMAQLHRAIGMGGDKLVPHVLSDDQAAALDTDKADVGRAAIFAQFHEQLTALPGAAELLRLCKRQGLKVGLASSASSADVRALLKAIDADDAIDAVTGADDADASKPEPDILEAALDKLGLPAEQVIFVGDAVWDVKAAARIGIPTVGLECGGSSKAELLEAGAVAVYRTPAHLAHHLAQSPL